MKKLIHSLGRKIFRKDYAKKPQSGYKVGFHLEHAEPNFNVLGARGQFIFDLRDLDGNQIAYWEKDNLITLDAGIQAARLFKDPTEPSNGIYMLAVGTGALGALLSPDAPDPRYRKLNGEIARKTFTSTTFRDGNGIAVAIPTNVVDFTTTFGAGEAVGALNEMGLICPISANPGILNPNPNTFPTYDATVDLSNYDVLINLLTFGVISKPAASVLTITWRITF